MFGRALYVLLKSSSELAMDTDLGLEVLCANGDRGGANAPESKPFVPNGRS